MASRVLEKAFSLLPASVSVTLSFAFLFLDDIAASHAERAERTAWDLLRFFFIDVLWHGIVVRLVMTVIGGFVHAALAERLLDAAEALLGAVYSRLVSPLLSALSLGGLAEWVAHGPRTPRDAVPFDDGRYDALVERVQAGVRDCPPGSRVVLRPRAPAAAGPGTGGQLLKFATLYGGTDGSHSSNTTRNPSYKDPRATEVAGNFHPVDSITVPGHNGRLTTANLIQFLNPPENTLLKVGPLASMADILDACGRASRLPSVVPEFPGLTAGGCFLGAGIESSSFRFGQWGDNGGVVGVECVDGEGNFHRLSLGPRRTRRESFILTDDAEPDAAEPEASSSAGNAAPGPRPDLRANDLKSSFGSLAVLTSLTLRLMPHPPGDRVRLAYILCRTPQMMVDVVRELSRMPGVDNVEGLAFSRREFVCIVGWLVSAADAAKARRARWLLRRSAGRSEGLGEAVAFDRGWDEYYFKHARRMASLGTPIPPTTTAEELPALLASLLNLSPTAGSSGGAQVPNVPFVHTSIPSYAFRHDRLAFWMAYPHFFSSVSVGPVAGAGLSDNWYSRALLDPMLRTKKLYQRLHRFSAQRDFVIQDFYVPMDSDGSEGAPSPAVSFLTTVVATATGPGIFPIWLCPIVGTSGPAGGGKLDPHYVAEGPDGRRRERMFLNFGIYGLPTLRCPVQSLRASVLGSAGGPNPPSDAQEPDLSAAAEEGDDERRADTKQVMLWTRHLERLCREHGGRKMLYAVSTYTRGEFWSIYDRGWHGAVKGEWDPRGVFMGVDEKVLGGW